jgi:hypothetical protein
MSENLADLTPEERATRICSQHEADIGNPMFRPTGEYSDTTKLVAALRDADRRAGALEELRKVTNPDGYPCTCHSCLSNHAAALDWFRERIEELEGE